MMNGWSPHGECFLWNPTILALFVIGNLLTALAYFVISLIVFMDWSLLPFSFPSIRASRPTLFSFATFILACGCTHVMDIIVLFTPAYAWQALVLIVCGCVSVTTALILMLLSREARRIVLGALDASSRPEQRIATGEKPVP